MNVVYIISHATIARRGLDDFVRIYFWQIIFTNLISGVVRVLLWCERVQIAKVCCSLEFL